MFPACGNNIMISAAPKLSKGEREGGWGEGMDRQHTNSCDYSKLQKYGRQKATA
jgi:hypothetical protein